MRTADPLPPLNKPEPAITVGRAVADVAQRFSASGIDTGRLDARLLMANVLGLASAHPGIHDERLLGPDDVRTFDRLCHARLAGTPISRLIGRRAFWRDEFSIDGETLDPRPDSETLIEQALAWVDRTASRDQPLRILDLGTGSGCLLLSILRELPAGYSFGLDLSLGACRTARANAVALGLDQRCAFVVGDWMEAVGGVFDLVLCNPPYIPSGDIAGLATEVRAFDPRCALDGGADGLASYRRVVPALHTVLSVNGCALLEVGIDQAASVADLAAESGFASSAYTDLAGVMRCIRLDARGVAPGGLNRR